MAARAAPVGLVLVVANVDGGGGLVLALVVLDSRWVLLVAAGRDNV